MGWSGLEDKRGQPGGNLIKVLAENISDLFSVAKNTQQHTWNAWHSFLMEEVRVLLFFSLFLFLLAFLFLMEEVSALLHSVSL